jgi:YbbR domain-containing protein
MSDRLASLLTQNIGTKVISVVIALVLWIVVLGSRNVEMTKEVPVEVITPADIVPSNEIPEKIAFRLAGPKAFLRAILDRREDPIRVNLSGAKPGLVTYRFFSDNIRVPIGVKVLSINPTAVLIKLEHLKRKDVPVRVELRGIPPEGYRLGKTEVKPTVVTIKGAETRVDGITEVSTVPIDVSNLRQTLEREVSLDLARYNIQLDSAVPRVLVEMEATSANYRIKNVDIRTLSSYKSNLGDNHVTVLVRAAPKDLKSIDRSKIFAEVDLRGKPRGKYDSVPIKVTLPENIGLVKTIPETVDVTLY